MNDLRTISKSDFIWKDLPAPLQIPALLIDLGLVAVLLLLLVLSFAFHPHERRAMAGFL
jgi:hypothetical protein